MSERISKKDLYWSYFSNFISIGSGIFILPLMLNALSSADMGLSYLMLSIGALVSLFDMGFGPQFGRNVSYIFGGAQELRSEGVVKVNNSSLGVNYKLLLTLIETSKYVYRRLSLIVLIIMVSFGTPYIYIVTDGFTTVQYSLLIWIIFSLSTFLNIYYSYYSSLLIGKGLIKESKKAIVFSRLFNVLVSSTLLLTGFGLLSVAVANLLSPFIERIISHRYFFTRDIKDNIDSLTVTDEEKRYVFKVIWYNARKLGLIFMGTHAVTRFSLFLAGLYLTLSEIASYGLMLQLSGIIFSISNTHFNINAPRFANLYVSDNMIRLKSEFAFSMLIFYILFILGSISFIFLCPTLLALFESKTRLPEINLLLLYLIIMILEGNHSNFSTMIVIENSVPFVAVALISGGATIVGSFLALNFTNYGLVGLVSVQGIVQLLYNNWKWPIVVLSRYNLSVYQFLALAVSELRHQVFVGVRSSFKC